MTTNDMLDNCIQIERMLGQIYGIFMEQQAEDPELSCLWRKTAQEENNHELQFLLAKRMSGSLKTDATKAFHPSAEIVKGLVALKSRVAETPLPPREALRLAIDLEEKLSRFHMSQMHIFSDDATNNLFSSMMNNDNEHVEALKKAYAALA